MTEYITDNYLENILVSKYFQYSILKNSNYISKAKSTLEHYIKNRNVDVTPYLLKIINSSQFKRSIIRDNCDNCKIEIEYLQLFIDNGLKIDSKYALLFCDCYDQNIWDILFEYDIQLLSLLKKATRFNNTYVLDRLSNYRNYTKLYFDPDNANIEIIPPHDLLKYMFGCINNIKIFQKLLDNLERKLTPSKFIELIYDELPQQKVTLFSFVKEMEIMSLLLDRFERKYIQNHKMELIRDNITKIILDKTSKTKSYNILENVKISKNSIDKLLLHYFETDDYIFEFLILKGADMSCVYGFIFNHCIKYRKYDKLKLTIELCQKYGEKDQIIKMLKSFKVKNLSDKVNRKLTTLVISKFDELGK